MDLKKIYAPIQKDLDNVDRVLNEAFSRTKNRSILKVADYLLESPGKRIRPALVILSAKVARSRKESKDIKGRLSRIASAIELVHMASLIHDDVVDHCTIRHHRPTVNSRWGQDVSIVLGDYLYSLAFKLIASCDNMDILDCISSAAKELCEGEFIQVAERGNLSLSKERYFIIVKKKTASLFAASCQAGAILSSSSPRLESALRAFGLNFGIAFQIIDDYLDIMSSQKEIGKPVGLDINVGELTLPLLFFADQSRNYFQKIFLNAQGGEKDLESLKRDLVTSGARDKTKREIVSYSIRAKENLKVFKDSRFKASLIALVDFIQERI